MPPVLGDRTIRREIKIYGVDGTVILSLSNKGLEAKAKGTKLGVIANWDRIIGACSTPTNVPSKFEGRPVDFLKFKATEREKRMTKKLAAEIAKETTGR